ncbi:hypothetical protein G7046_g1732 [Stylonectria norvegica]|nr:hypothetical protein G7046_g1732 [Stylonectria norvegica]
MPPFAAELEEWWLSCGLASLTSLVDSNELDLIPQDCGFAQALQRILRNFDNDRTLQDDIQATWPAIRAARGIDYNANPRKRLKEASRSIFQRSEDGGIDASRVMDGLGYLDAMEIHRLRLVKATKAAMQAASPEERHYQVVEELHQTATRHFGHFHMGFRTSTLIKELSKPSDQRKNLSQLMARLNALFPSTVLLEDDDDIDPSSCSPGLRDSIRFSVFEHLMSGDPFSEKQQKMIQLKLLCWCDIPDYARAREALIRYSEESKKLEEVCLAVLHDLERRSFSNISTTNASFVSAADRTMSPEPYTISPRKPSPEVTLLADESFGSRCSGPNSPLGVPSVPNPLLRGMPGREISAAKTDGAAFAGDTTVPPILSYPDDISNTEFHQHPEDEEDDEKKPNARSKSPSKKWRRRKVKEDVPPVPQLPPIPEYLRSGMTPKVFGKMVKRMRSRSQMIAKPMEDVATATSRRCPEESEASKIPSGRRRPLLKSQISDPELVFGGDGWTLHAKRDSGAANPLPDILQHGRQVESRNLVTLDSCQPTWEGRDGSAMKYQLSRPRLSPMEYTRIYLIEKALSKREGRACELPEPEKTWYWTPGWEKFLIIPRIPDCIKRDFTAGGLLADGSVSKPKETGREDSDEESVAIMKADASGTGYPRLSLNLGGVTLLLPSFMDLPCGGGSKGGPSVLETLTFRAQPSLRGHGKRGTEEEKLRIDLDWGRRGSSCSDEAGSSHCQASIYLRASPTSSGPNQRNISNLDEPRDEGNENSAERSVLSFRDPRNAIQALPRIEITNGKGIRNPQERSRTGLIKEMDLDRVTETSSAHSQDSAKTALCVGSQDYQRLVVSSGPKPQLPQRPLSPTITDFCSSHFTNQTPLRRMVECSPQTYSSEAPTPIAHFPIATQPTLRLTPSTMARQVIGGAGGCLRPEDAHQARIVQSISVDLLQGISADVWTEDSEESMLSELQPEPLRLSRRVSQIDKAQNRRGSVMLQGVTEEIVEKMRDLQKDDEQDAAGDFASLETGNGFSQGGQDASYNDSRYEETRGREGAGLASQDLQRSSSQLITPTTSLNCLMDRSPSFNIAAKGPSGFTPRHSSKQSVAQWTIPRSPMMSDLRDAETLTRDSSQVADAAVNQMQQNERLDIFQSKDPASHKPAAPQEHGPSLKQLERAVGTTPPAMKSFTLWRNGISNKGQPRTDEEEKCSTWRHTSVLSTETFDTSTSQEFEPLQPTLTRDFSRPAEPKKARPKHKPIPVDAYRFSSQRFDPSTRTTSTIAQRSEFAVTDLSAPSPPEPEDAVLAKTPTSAIGSLFRKRVRSEYGGNTTPRTPVTPSLQWKPFEEPREEPPCSSPWLSGQIEDRRDKTRRAEYFREKVEREKVERENTLRKETSKTSSGKSSLRSVDSKNGGRWKKLDLERQQSMESMVGWKSFIDDTSVLASTSPVPPLPPLPTPSRLSSLPSTTTQDFSATSTTTGAGAAAYKTKKPDGLKVETKKLRKVSKEQKRPARTPNTASNGGLKTAFKMDGHRLSFGRVVEDGDTRVDEVVERRGFGPG